MKKYSVSFVALFLVLSVFAQAGAQVLPILGAADAAYNLGKVAAPYVKEYGPKAVDATKKYGPKALDATKKYGTQAVDAAKDSGKGIAGFITVEASRAVFKGKEIIKRNETFNPHSKDATGITNVERMQKGKAPLGTDGNPVQIHHDKQSGRGTLFEVTAKEHKAIPVDRTKGGGLSPDERKEFNSWRPEYWKQRAQDVWEGKK
ncbi:MAG: HNH/ENDO VII family nuclease [Desulfomonilaceae bacterium]